MTEFLFVVGSLVQGFPHHQLIAPFIRSEDSIEMRGQLYKLQVGYPVFSDVGQQMVAGSLYEVEHSEGLNMILDQIHLVHSADPSKGLHTRKSVVDVLNGSERTITYFDVNIAKLPKSAQPMDSSNWKEHLNSFTPLPLKLTDQQRTYIKRLGQSSGREIVPIDLPLYRELMKLEMIVDKGRRLALSALGKETFRYL